MSRVLPVEPVGDVELRGAVDLDGGSGVGVREDDMVDLLADEGGAAAWGVVSGCRDVQDVLPAEKLGLARDSLSYTSRSALQAR